MPNGKIVLDFSHFHLSIFHLSLLDSFWKYQALFSLDLCRLLLAFPISKIMNVIFGSYEWLKWKLHFQSILKKWHVLPSLDITAQGCFHKENVQLSVTIRTISISNFHINQVPAGGKHPFLYNFFSHFMYSCISKCLPYRIRGHFIYSTHELSAYHFAPAAERYSPFYFSLVTPRNQIIFKQPLARHSQSLIGPYVIINFAGLVIRTGFLSVISDSF